MDYCPKFFRAAIPPIVPFRVRVHTITLSVHLNDPFRAAGTDGLYADTESGTSRPECAVRVPKRV